MTWVSRSPGRIPPYAQLIGAMDLVSWMLTFGSILTVAIALFLFVKVFPLIGPIWTN